MADKQGYQKNTPVYGNLAYDLDALVRERNLERAGRMLDERQQMQSAPRSRQHEASRPQVSLLTLGAVALLAVMAVCVLLGYVKLTRISASVSEIRTELSELERERVALVTKYEQTYDLTTIKQRAEKAGMRKPTSGQIEYIDLGGTDAAKIYRAGSERSENALLQAVKHGWQTAVEYFR